jgi:hypothetical protein
MRSGETIINMRVGKDLERTRCGQFHCTTPIIGNDAGIPTKHVQNANLDYSLHINMLYLCYISSGVVFDHPGLCPFDNTEFECKLRAPTRWRLYVPPMT